MPITGPDSGCLQAEVSRPGGLLPTVLVAAVALIDADNRVLLARRPEGRAMAGLWEFPGGKVEDGEQPEAAVVREVREELGIDITESCLAPLTFASHVYDDFHLLMPLFVCRVWQGRRSCWGEEGMVIGARNRKRGILPWIKHGVDAGLWRRNS